MNREELLAKCPTLAAITERRLREAPWGRDPAKMSAREKELEADDMEEADRAVVDALDEVLALINPPAERTPAQAAGIVSIDNRVLCTFAFAEVTNPTVHSADRSWLFGACQFRDSAQFVADAFNDRRTVHVAWGLKQNSQLHVHDGRVSGYGLSGALTDGDATLRSVTLHTEGGTVTCKIGES